MDASLTPAGPGTYMIAIDLSNAIRRVRKDLLGGAEKPTAPPHQIDMRDWLKENWEEVVAKVPVVAWRQDQRAGVFPLLAGPQSKELDSFYLYSASGEKRTRYSRGFVLLPDGEYWDGGLHCFGESELINIWSDEILSLIAQRIEAGKSLVESA